MIEIENSRFGIPFTYIWFAERPSRAAALRPVTYMHCAHLGDVMGFARAKKFTKIIDLREPPESILKGMSKNTSYKVKRAQREGVTLVTAVSMMLVVWSLLPTVVAGGRPEVVLAELMPGLSIAFKVEPLGILFAALASLL